MIFQITNFPNFAQRTSTEALQIPSADIRHPNKYQKLLSTQERWASTFSDRDFNHRKPLTHRDL